MREKGRERLALGAAILLTAVLALLSVRVGSYPLSTGQILDILSGGLAGTTPAHVLWNLRLPRVGMGLLAGWALGMAGGVYQTVFRNPLASPDLTGVASGPPSARPGPSCWGRGPPSRSWGAPLSWAACPCCWCWPWSGGPGWNAPGPISWRGSSSPRRRTRPDGAQDHRRPRGELAAIEFWTMGSLSAMTGDKLRGLRLPSLIPLALLSLAVPPAGPRPGAPSVAGLAGPRRGGDRPGDLAAAAVRPDGEPFCRPWPAPAEHLDRAVRGPGAHRTASSGKGGEP